MKSIACIVFSFWLLPALAQSGKMTTQTVKVFGNCGMCEEKIEAAGQVKNKSTVDWKENLKTATITYDASLISLEAILKKIALAGYDNEQFLAPAAAYAALPACCQYERTAKAALLPMEKPVAASGHEQHTAAEHRPEVAGDTANPLSMVLEKYLSVKDALVNSDAGATATQAKALVSALETAKIAATDKAVYPVWKKASGELLLLAGKIAASKDISKQRDAFMGLSSQLYSLLKATNIDDPVYYQFCPMANDGKGANWLSKDDAIRNPYYGAQMLSCGRTVETLK